MNDSDDALTAGIAAADGPEQSKEYADVAKWATRIEQARKFDEPARIQYARDRRYARGDSGGEVDANIAGTNIDILESFLYAKDPDFDVTPGPSVRPPSLEALRDAAEAVVMQDPAVIEAGRIAASVGIAAGADQNTAMQMGEMAQEAKTNELIQKQVIEMRKRYQKRNREVKAFAETCEIIGSSLWQDASLKRRGRPWVRSGLTIGLGVIKASWQERTAPSPETTTGINDMQANIARAKAQLKALAEGDAGFMQRAIDGVLSVFGSDQEAKLAEYERQLATLQAQPEVVESRGYVIDCVAGEDFQVAPGYTIANHLDAPWNAHRIFMQYEDALAEFGDLVPELKMKEAVRYSARKPEMCKQQAALIDPNVEAKDADAYTQGVNEEGGDFVALWEIWDRDTNSVLTRIEGVKCWVKEAWTPTATTRFYPFFLFCSSEVDGQRHPQSKVSRASKLLDEYNRIGSAEAEHRRRVRPKMMFNAGAMDDENAKKLEKGVTAEMVGVKTTVPKMDLRNLLYAVQYPQLDPALYDRSRIINEIERIFGVQEAVAGSVEVQKTATEADIQQQGFTARTGGQRDLLESALSELALYTIEVARAYVTLEDAQAIAGPDAMWPEYEGPDDLLRMVNVNIRAGTTGKPNTAKERESWSALLPLLQNGIVQIGQLRGSTPADIADSLEKLLLMTAERMGDHIDMESLVPQAGAPTMPGLPGAPVPGQPGDPNAPPVDPSAGAPPVETAVPIAA